MKLPFDLADEREFDVVGFGTNAVDYLIRVPRFPAFGSKVEMSGHETLPGGEVASTLVGLSRLGARTVYAGRFGDDEAGRIGVDSLARENVNVASAEVVAGSATQVGFIIIDDVTGERTVLWQRDPRLGYTAQEAPLHLAANGRILHMTAHDTPAAIRMAAAARAAGTIVSLDVDRAFDGIGELIGLADICIMSAEFPVEFFGIRDMPAALQRAAREYGCGVMGVTLGSDGSLIYTRGEVIQTPSVRVPGGCVDTTGAGDAFRTGFLHGVLTGETVERCAELANQVAALKCRRVGARSGLPHLAELQK